MRQGYCYTCLTIGGGGLFRSGHYNEDPKHKLLRGYLGQRRGLSHGQLLPTEDLAYVLFPALRRVSWLPYVGPLQVGV